MPFGIHVEVVNGQGNFFKNNGIPLTSENFSFIHVEVVNGQGNFFKNNGIPLTSENFSLISHSKLFISSYFNT